MLLPGAMPPRAIRPAPRAEVSAMQPSEPAPVHEPTEPVLVNPSADRTQRWCRVGRHRDTPEKIRAIYAAHRARIRRIRWRAVRRWFKALLRR